MALIREEEDRGSTSSVRPSAQVRVTLTIVDAEEGCVDEEEDEECVLYGRGENAFEV